MAIAATINSNSQRPPRAQFPFVDCLQVLRAQLAMIVRRFQPDAVVVAPLTEQLRRHFVLHDGTMLHLDGQSERHLIDNPAIPSFRLEACSQLFLRRPGEKRNGRFSQSNIKFSRQNAAAKHAVDPVRCGENRKLSAASDPLSEKFLLERESPARAYGTQSCRRLR